MARIRLIVILACVLGLVALGAYALLGKPRASVTSQGSDGSVQLGGPFQLVDQDRQPQDQSLLKGRWSAVFFGFTYCPDVCPTTLQTLGAASRLMGAEAKDLQIIFVSVDPERDTPDKLKAYLASPGFPKGVIGLTGSQDQVTQIAKAYRVYFAKEGSGETYLVNHTSLIYLMNPKGEFSRVLAYGLTPDETAKQIRQAMAQG